MADGTTLPPALAPWGPELAVLEVDIAIALGPMLRQIDRLVAGPDLASATIGQPDGFNGIAHRGDLAHVLPSEWALADELPLEFLRRATSGELLYLDPAFLEERGRGRVAVLVDVGPDQIGAGRLVQLAALIALNRRARSRESDLSIGVLGQEPGAWLTGDFDAQLRAWLVSRSDTAPTPADLAAWLDRLEINDDEDTWVLAGPGLAATQRGRRRMLTSHERAWSAAGATAVEVVVEGRQIELALPIGPAAVRALRGAGFRSRGPGLTPVIAHPIALRLPAFPSPRPRLLARGDGDSELFAIHLEDNALSTRARRYSFHGRVIAASFIGARTVAVTEAGGELRVEVVGKPLGHTDQISVATSAVSITDEELDAASTTQLRPAYFAGGALVFPLGERWIWLAGGRQAYSPGIAAIAAGRALDNPRIAYRSSRSVFLDGQHFDRTLHVLFGAGDRLATSLDGATWTLSPAGDLVQVPDAETVLGLVELAGGPALLTVSSAGLIVRAHTPTGSRTLTKWSGTSAIPAVHPTKPWIAVQRDNGTIEVADLNSDAVLAIVRGTT